MSEPRDPSVVPLTGARIPADQGLAGLGLLMQLGGSLTAIVTAAAGIIASFLLLVAPNDRHGVGMFIAFFVAIATIIAVFRSLAQRNAGFQILYGERPRAAIHHYVAIAVFHSAVIIGFCALIVGVGSMTLLSLAIVLLGWPVTLLVFSLRREVRAIPGAVPMAEDAGRASAATLMVALGLGGLAMLAAPLIIAVGIAPEMWIARLSLWSTIVCIALLLRSLLHIYAGWCWLTGRSDRASAATKRYASTSTGTAVGLTAFGLIGMFVLGGGSVAVAGFAAAVWLLVLWPLQLRRFFEERGHIATIGAGAPDQGLTALGWLLVAAALVAVGLAPLATTAAATEVDTAVPFLVLAPATLAGPWVGFGIGLLQLWAGIELVGMTRRHRIAATTYAIASIAAAIGLVAPELEARDLARDYPFQLAIIGVAALGLGVPIATMWLANRRRPESARARYRSR